MFAGASSFNQPLNDWRVDKVTNMGNMFINASSFNQPLNDWRVGVGVPPGPLGVSFVDGTCTVHAVKPTSPLGAKVEGATLLSVDGEPVTPATIFDVVKAADDGTGERKLVFADCDIHGMFAVSYTHLTLPTILLV